jgi:hypothetical protein
MTLKVKIVTGDDNADLETNVNAFLAGKDPANVLDVAWVTMRVGANMEQACSITYQE